MSGRDSLRERFSKKDFIKELVDHPESGVKSQLEDTSVLKTTMYIGGGNLIFITYETQNVASEPRDLHKKLVQNE